MKKGIARVFALAAVALFIAGCETADFDAVRNLATEGSDFPGALTAAYRNRALAPRAAGAITSSRPSVRLAQKALRADAGHVDPPEAPAEAFIDWLTVVGNGSGLDYPIGGRPGQERIPHPVSAFSPGFGSSGIQRRLLVEAREGLIDALARGGRHLAPTAAAEAQAAYDCWLLGDSQAVACRADFAPRSATLRDAVAGRGWSVDAALAGKMPLCDGRAADKRYILPSVDTDNAAVADAWDRALIESARLRVCREPERS